MIYNSKGNYSYKKEQNLKKTKFYILQNNILLIYIYKTLDFESFFNIVDSG